MNSRELSKLRQIDKGALVQAEKRNAIFYTKLQRTLKCLKINCTNIAAVLRSSYRTRPNAYAETNANGGDCLYHPDSLGIFVSHFCYKCVVQ